VQDIAHVLERPFLYDGRYSPFRDRRHGAPAGDLGGDRFVVHLQNHDQVGNRARGERLTKLLEPPALRLAASLLLLAPHLPLLFMGEEYGEENPFLFFCSFQDPELVESVREGRRREFAAFAWHEQVPDPQDEATFAASRLSWSWTEAPRAGLRRLYADLLKARRTWPALGDFNNRRARLSPERIGRVVELVRGDEHSGRVRILFNLQNEPHPVPPADIDAPRLLFASEARHYEGKRPSSTAVDLLPYECLVWGPARWEPFAEPV
jgi:maltooligosyltrehalose trehalohydrolase